MSTDPLKTPSLNTDQNDSLGIVFNESTQPDNTKSVPHTPPTPNLKTPIPHAHRSTTSFEEDSLEAGTIVSDRRTARASLSKNLQAAFTEWWTGTQKSLERGFNSALKLASDDTPPETIIPTAETRADTIREAAVYTSQAPKDDHSYVREKISNELKEEPLHKSEPIHIKEISSHPQETVWTHTVLEQNVDAPVVNIAHPTGVKEISEAEATVSQTVRKVPAPAATVSFAKPAPHEAVAIAPHSEVMPAKPTFVVSKNSNARLSTAPAEEVVSSKTLAFPGRAIPLPTKQDLDLAQNLPPLTLSHSDVSQNNTVRRILKWIILCGIVVFGAGLAYFASTRFNIFEESVLPPAEETFVIIPKLFETDTQTSLTLPQDKSSFLTDLHSKIQGAPNGISQFYPVIQGDSARRAATTEEIFTLLNTRLSDTVIRTFADTMVLGSVTIANSKNEPFMVLQSSRFDILFSGLLSWEHSLQSDLSPLFGDTLSTESFTDATIANKSVRILKDVQGNEILLYAFIDQSTVVITTSRDALIKIFGHF